jgi:hypothetical protein
MERTALSGLWREIRKISAPAYIIDLVGLTAALVVIEWIIPGPASLAALSPHPLWIPVVLISTSHGTTAGVYAAIAAIAASFIAGWPPQMHTEDFYAHALRVWEQPTLWLIAAVVLGELRNRQLQAVGDRDHELARLTTEHQAIGSFCRELESQLTALDRHCATAQEVSAQTSFARLADVRASRAEAIAPALAAAVDALLDPSTEYQVYLRRDRVLVAVDALCRGGTRSEHGPGSALFDEVFTRQRLLSLLSLRGPDAALLAGLGMFAAPIMGAGRSTPVGVIVISFTDWQRLGPATEVALQVLAGELATPLLSQTVARKVRTAA